MIKRALYWASVTHTLRPKATWFPIRYNLLGDIVFTGIYFGIYEYNPHLSTLRLVGVLLVALITAIVAALTVENICKPK